MAASSGNAFVIVILLLKLAGFKLNINLYCLDRSLSNSLRPFGIIPRNQKVIIICRIHSTNEGLAGLHRPVDTLVNYLSSNKTMTSSLILFIS
jgi:hypothetical protein